MEMILPDGCLKIAVALLNASGRIRRRPPRPCAARIRSKALRGALEQAGRGRDRGARVCGQPDGKNRLGR